ncbi:hypothetical protein K456DRAFT_38604 [Colletotrichum gloeosporioides 23]|nr:hypothetical protein K456DRAFT_38604 [Colletotrichum gloeosporioides 23]
MRHMSGGGWNGSAPGLLWASVCPAFRPPSGGLAPLASFKSGGDNPACTLFAVCRSKLLFEYVALLEKALRLHEILVCISVVECNLAGAKLQLPALCKHRNGLLQPFAWFHLVGSDILQFPYDPKSSRIVHNGGMSEARGSVLGKVPPLSQA